MASRPISGQITRWERHHPGHETEIGIRFAGPNQLVHLIGLGEVVPRLGRGVADRLDRPVQPTEDLTNGNQPASFTLHGFYFSLSSGPIKSYPFVLLHGPLPFPPTPSQRFIIVTSFSPEADFSRQPGEDLPDGNQLAAFTLHGGYVLAYDVEAVAEVSRAHWRQA